MLFIIIPFTISLISILVLRYKSLYWDDETTAQVLSVLFGIIFTIASIAVPIARYENRMEILKYKSLKETVEKARINKNDLERVAFLQSISEQNQWVAVIQEQNKSTLWLDIFIPDEVNELKPIE